MYVISILNNVFNGVTSRPPIPPVCEGMPRPPQALIDAAIAQGNGYYEVLMDGTLGPKMAEIPAQTYSQREIKLQQANSFLRGYARDFILGAQTPTNAQRNNALDALIAIQVIEEMGD